MDVNLSISNEDLDSILRTILMFLDNINFKSTSTVFKNECISKGFLNFLSTETKTFVVTLTTSGCDKETLTSNQTIKSPEFTNENSQTLQDATSLSKFEKDVDKSRLHSKTRNVLQSSYSIETDTPSIKSGEEKIYCLRRSASNPILNTNFELCNLLESGQNCGTSENKELRNKLQKLETEHQKLMGVATELTVALQTQIMGQSENLNSTLNNCKNIYPDLFGNMENSYPTTESLPAKETNEKETFKQVNEDTESLESDTSRYSNQPRQQKVNSADTKNRNNSLRALKRPYSSGVVATEEKRTEPNRLSVSCDESLIATPLQVEESYPTEKVQQSETRSNSVTFAEPPRIFITTENLAKPKKSLSKTNSITSASSSPRGYFDLDFKRLKKDLLTGDDDLKARLAQALRWRITCSDGEIRDQVISSYIRHDLLSLHSLPKCGEFILELFLCPDKQTPDALQEVMARLLNTFASVTLGRDYLSQDDDLLVALLIPLAMGTHHSKTKIDDNTHDMLIAILQKLSLRYKQRLKMISAGLVEYLVSFLSARQNEVSEYCIEYATALLMNLCLHSETRERLHPLATNIVSLLADLMNTKHKCCMPYVNGAMYSLLSDPHINQEAKRLNLANLIEHHIKRTDGEMRTQLEFILKLHQEGNEDNECICDPYEPQNEVDLLELELDIGDPIENDPSGEELLQNYKLLFPAYGSQVYPNHLKCICRPITPVPRTASNTSSKEIDGIELNDKEQKTKSELNDSERKTKSQSNGDEKTDNNGNKNVLPSTEEEKTAFQSQTSSRSESPDVAYSEDTKQFYHIPSVKSGIFEKPKPKKTHKVAPSFTRTIPLSSNTDRLSRNCCNPHCPAPYTKTMPFVPKENSSARNPPYALYCPLNYGVCYRESFSNTSNGCSCCNCKPSKYRCGCYNVIKGYVDQDNLMHSDSGKHKRKTEKTNKTQPCNCNVPNLQTCNIQNNQFSSCNCNKCNTSTTSGINQNSDPKQIINFSYEEFLSSTNLENRDHSCANEECICYDEAFQSRPRILRTPP